MDLRMLFLPHEVNTWEVTRCIASILHSDEFPRQRDSDRVQRPINFKVVLNKSKAGGVQNDGSGVLTMPKEGDATRFLTWIRDKPLRIGGKKIKVYKYRPANLDLASTLDRTPYIDPNLEEEHEAILRELQDSFRIDAVQFGVYYRPEYPSTPSEPLLPRAFSIEWEKKYTTENVAWLAFEYDHKAFRIKLGNEMVEETGQSIEIHFGSIQKMALGYNPNPYICFDTLTPPIFEEIKFHQGTTGNERQDKEKSKTRVGSLHPGHAVVAPYAQQLRLVLYSPPTGDVIKKFRKMCEIARLQRPSMIIQCDVQADRRGFITQKRLYKLGQVFKDLPWPVAFQLESLLRNCLLNTDDIDAILPQVTKLCDEEDFSANNAKQGAHVGALLRKYHEELERRPIRESPFACFSRVKDKYKFTQSSLSSGHFQGCHVTVTPTRMILEGPYATQSNRVVRKYQDYQDSFIRVDFRDEDRLQYRWDREVDGSTLLHDRVGGILKHGFELGGRQFEFLAYSSSALREHAVWFMSPFFHKDEGWINSDKIRRGLGNFERTQDLMKSPSKFAARLAQAFTATDRSVKVSHDQWEKVDDLGQKPYLFTDGMGTISKELGNKIWEALCVDRRDVSNAVQPSAYQIRFLGYKGVVAVDEQLEGIFMRLRRSMEKFVVDTKDDAEIEIAQAFEHPNNCYLNRPLVTVLEGHNVSTHAFVELQEKAIADARTVHDSSSQFRALLDKHGLGRSFRLSYLLSRVEQLGLDLNPQNNIDSFDNAFLMHLRQISMLNVLRDIKYNARIPIPESYLLVGVADEGPVYQAAGKENVYVLPENRIYACVQKSKDEEPVWLKGICTISRSPVAHPGDVQRVYAIGKPPEDQLCFFRNLKNLVVLPSVGKRSLASCLSGGDVDGDLFMIICYGPLLPKTVDLPADYPPGITKMLDRDCDVKDICDFIVEYISSDLLGLVSDRLLVIADQSKDGIRDERCQILAELCSQAVDYPKQGIPVPVEDIPRPLIRYKPDWHATELKPRNTDYYESDRALGILYRRISLNDPEPEPLKGENSGQYYVDPISRRLEAMVYSHLGGPAGSDMQEVEQIFKRYLDELDYILTTHTLTKEPDARLSEAEVVIGTINARSPQKRWRTDRIYRMRLHADTLVKDIQQQFVNNPKDADRFQLTYGLESAWKAWGLSQRKGNAPGANSFGLIALRVIFDCLDKLGGVTPAEPFDEEEFDLYE